jgi:hypothetical protein
MKQYRPGEGEARAPAPKPVSSRADRIVTVEVKRERLDVVEQLMLRGVSQNKIEHVCKEKFNIGRLVARKYMAEIRDRWADEERVSRPSYKAQAMRRLYNHIQKARDTDNWAAVAQLERLLSDIQGTKEPVEVNMNVDARVTEAALHVVATLTPERREEIIERQKRLRLLSTKASEG